VCVRVGDYRVSKRGSAEIRRTELVARALCKMGWNKVMVMVVVYVVAIDDGVLFFAVERALC
jgi:hypothetical protein